MRSITPRAALAFATAPVASASAATYAANFDTATLDPGLGFTGGLGYALASGGGFLTLSYAIPSTSQSVLVNPSIYTRFSILGDYTARVTIDFSGQALDDGSGAGSAAFVTHDGSNDFDVLGTDRAIGGSYVSGYQSLSGVGATTGYASSSTNVTLQFQRIGQTLIESFADGRSGFQTLSTTSDSSYGGPASFTLSSFYNGMTGASGVLRFSNFVITTPDAPAVPEAATWAMMIAGFGLIGGALRRGRYAGLRPLAI